MTYRIGNASGFYGDRFSAVREMLTGGPLDVLTGDYLAELTMLILGRDRMKDPNRGYAKTFLRQMEENLELARENNVKIVANAGGLNPAGLADALRELADKLGLDVKIAHVEGDDLVARADELELGKPLTANAYLGAWGIAECLNAGADVVVTGRVTDASVIVGPAAAHYGWARDDYDALAGAVAAGHVIECGAQATGGNYAFFTEHSLGVPGFPIAEIEADGSSVITKHPGTGGVVNAGTVTAQLLYEITGARYAGPDVTTRFDTLSLSEEGPDRVRISGVRGEAPPPTLKVALNTLGGFRNETTFVLTGLDIEAKAALVREQLEGALKARPPADVKLDAGPDGPRRRRHRADRERAAARRRQGRRPQGGGPRVHRGRGRARAGQLPRLPRHRAAVGRLALRRLHRGLCGRRPGAARRRAAGRHASRHSAIHVHPGAVRCGRARAARAARPRAGAAGAARPRHRRAQW